MSMPQSSTETGSLAMSDFGQTLGSDFSSSPEVQRKARVVALAQDFLAWRQKVYVQHRKDVGFDDLRDAIARIVGESETPSTWAFRKYFEVNANREMPAKFERAWVIITGGDHLRVHHEQTVYGLHYRPRGVNHREILAGMEVAA